MSSPSCTPSSFFRGLKRTLTQPFRPSVEFLEIAFFLMTTAGFAGMFVLIHLLEMGFFPTHFPALLSYLFLAILAGWMIFAAYTALHASKKVVTYLCAKGREEDFPNS